MTEKHYTVLECTNPDCRFRFSNEVGAVVLENCPCCQSPLASRWTHYSNSNRTLESRSNTHRKVVAVLDGIRSTLNVGSMFRTADGAGINHIYLCGLTATPDHPKLSKTGLGAEWSIPWSHHPNVLDLVSDLKRGGFFIAALEGCEDSIPLYALSSPLPDPIALVVGNEVSGIDPAVLDLADARLFLPMAGYKRSLNVAVAFGIAAYTLCYQQPTILPAS
jgi:23S rRNA (guanosine2251-2'-O)-methyltransferase